MALIKRTRNLAAKAEGTPGTAEALTAAEAAFNVFNTVIQQGAEFEHRESQGGFAQLAGVVSGRQGKATFGMHFIGASASPAGWAVLLPAVGLGLTGAAYVADARPVGAAGSTQETITIGSYQAGRKKFLHGCMGNAKFTFPASKLAFGEFEFTGKWNAPTDVAILDPTYSVLVPMRVVSAALTVGAYGEFKISQAVIDLGNEIHLREDVDDATGYGYAAIGNRLNKVTIDPEAELVATKDLYGEWLAGTRANLSLVITNGTDTCTVTASNLQFVNPQEADRGGIETDNIECIIGDDDLTFTFT